MKIKDKQGVTPDNFNNSADSGYQTGYMYIQVM